METLSSIYTVSKNQGYYKTSLRNNGKKVELCSTVFDKVDVKANDAMITDNLNAPIGIKGLDVSDFIKGHNEKIDHLIGGGVLDPANQFYSGDFLFGLSNIFLDIQLLFS